MEKKPKATGREAGIRETCTLRKTYPFPLYSITYTPPTPGLSLRFYVAG